MMPEKIWANHSPYFLPSGQLTHIGYWWEEPAKDADPYIRADIHERMKAERDELYEALDAVVRIADRATVEFDRAKAALAKARGEA